MGIIIELLYLSKSASYVFIFTFIILSVCSYVLKQKQEVLNNLFRVSVCISLYYVLGAILSMGESMNKILHGLYIIVLLVPPVLVYLKIKKH